MGKPILKVGTRVRMKRQISKREAVIVSMTGDGKLFLVMYDNGRTKVVSKNSIERVEKDNEQKN
jgi:hypothetical protein